MAKIVVCGSCAWWPRATTDRYSTYSTDMIRIVISSSGRDTPGAYGVS